MTSQIQSQLLPVSFHGDTLFVVSHEGEPFTPARPIVQGMGIRWQSQQRKLAQAKQRWGVIMMMTPTKTGPQATLCIPVRKLAAFLATIDPRRVRPEIRAKIELYQAECDDALWSYWTKGEALNPRRFEAETKVRTPEPVRQIPAARPLPPETTAISNREYVELLKTKIAFLEMRGRTKTTRQSPRPVTSADAAEIRQLHSSGFTKGAIARRLNRSTSTVCKVLKGAIA
ncbi:MAG TPA: phage antirepressor N-terminal domain-containing protein [Candidatus Ozemobacteraceae bacterium]|nr:phage antirepressor N-terminal domain-containing protein [Candidatus Ozemobacteraceae bacterium]